MLVEAGWAQRIAGNETERWGSVVHGQDLPGGWKEPLTPVYPGSREQASVPLNMIMFSLGRR
jgi:hypothetical protein